MHSRTTNHFLSYSHPLTFLHHIPLLTCQQSPLYLSHHSQRRTRDKPNNSIAAREQKRTCIIRPFASQQPPDRNDASQAFQPKEIDNPAQARDRLLSMLTTFISAETTPSEIEQIILQLESFHNTPATEAFTELALSGHWVLLFTSSRTGTDGMIRIREIGQTFDIEKKTMTNKVVWNYTSADGVYNMFANLAVNCSYQFVAPGRMEVSILEHKVTVEEGEGIENNVPKDLQSVVLQLQRALPFEFFDPSGLIDVSYIEPDFRIMRFMGERVVGVRHVFVRPEQKADAE